MKRIPALFAMAALTSLAACDMGAKKQLVHSDSARADSIVRIKDEMLNEVMASTRFVSELNAEIAKLKTPLKTGLKVGSSESQLAQAQAERDAVTERVRELVARLDSSEARVASLRTRAATPSSPSRSRCMRRRSASSARPPSASAPRCRRSSTSRARRSWR